MDYKHHDAKQVNTSNH